MSQQNRLFANTAASGQQIQADNHLQSFTPSCSGNWCRFRDSYLLCFRKTQTSHWHCTVVQRWIISSSKIGKLVPKITSKWEPNSFRDLKMFKENLAMTLKWQRSHQCLAIKWGAGAVTWLTRLCSCCRRKEAICCSWPGHSILLHSLTNLFLKQDPSSLEQHEVSLLGAHNAHGESELSVLCIVSVQSPLICWFLSTFRDCKVLLF